MLLHADLEMLAEMGAVLGDASFERARRLESWRALPLLNELRARSLGKDDPVAWYEQKLATRIRCSGGKGYQWNADAMSMESVAFGHPAAPRSDASPLPVMTMFDAVFSSLEFESDGLRMDAKMVKGGESD